MAEGRPGVRPLPDALVELVMARVHESMDARAGWLDPINVRIVLAALFDACEVREEWGYRLTYPARFLMRSNGIINAEPHPVERWVGSGDGDRRHAEIVAASPANWREPGPPGTVLRRYVLITPAEVVPVASGEDRANG